jgi:hypothetical protein
LKTFFFLIIIRLLTRFNLDRFCNCFTIMYKFLDEILLIHFSLQCQINLLNLSKFELGISNALASLLYLPLVSDTLALSIQQYIIFYGFYYYV